jgi:hypothetical protein
VRREIANIGENDREILAKVIVTHVPASRHLRIVSATDNGFSTKRYDKTAEVGSEPSRRQPRSHKCLNCVTGANERRCQTVTMPNQEAIENFLDSLYQTDYGEPVPVLKRLPMVLRHPVLTVAALRFCAGFPVVKVALSPTETSADWLFDPRRPWRYHGFISSYIELPSPLDRYWQGTSKQNLRTRSHHARVSGLAVMAVGPSQREAVIGEVWRDKGWSESAIEEELRKIRDALDGVVCVGVFDANGHAVGFSVGVQSGEVVRTLWSYASQRGTVRWLCFSGYVEEVSAKGGRFIVESPPWAFIGGNKIFAGHLGFLPARIRRA